MVHKEGTYCPHFCPPQPLIVRAGGGGGNCRVNYELECQLCPQDNKTVYIGETGRNLYTRSNFCRYVHHEILCALLEFSAEPRQLGYHHHQHKPGGGGQVGQSLSPHLLLLPRAFLEGAIYQMTRYQMGLSTNFKPQL